MKLFSDEKLLIESDNKEVLLTTHRVILEKKKTDKEHLISIMLENISSCEVHFKSNIWLIVLMIVSLLCTGYCIYTKLLSGFLVSIFFSSLFLLLFLITKKHVVTISSPTASIDYFTHSKTAKDVINFLDTVDQAKNERMISLK